MALFYKKLIAKNLTRNILNSFQHADFKEVESKIEQLVRVAPNWKEKKKDSHFVVSLSQLSQFLQGKTLNLDQIQIEKEIAITLSDDLLHFKTEPSHFAQKVLWDVKTHSVNYGYSNGESDSKKHICVEFSSPNVAKPFHVGHLRSTIIGNVISNLYEAAGHTVKRINWIGDWGTQFGLLTLGLHKFGNIELLKQDPLLELFNVYVKINQCVTSECGKSPESTSPTYQEGMSLSAQLELGEENMLAVWRLVRDLSMEELNKMYQRLGVQFTHILSESDYHSKTQEVLEHLSQNNLLHYDSDGVGYVKMASQDIGRASVVKTDGSSLYLTRDIASALDRQEKFSFDIVHYVVENGQRGHFVKLATILQQLGVPWAKSSIDDIHIRFGRIKGMSTRQGNVVFLRDVLDEAKTRVLETMLKKSTTRVTSKDLEVTADKLGVTSIILQDLKARRTNDYTFSWEKMLNLKADSGVFVQYCHARLNSMIANCGVQPVDEVDISYIIQDNALMNIVLHLARYPDIFQHSLNSLEPHHIVQYLFTLCHLVNTAYASCKVKGESQDLAQARLLTFQCAKQVLHNSLTLLGLRPLDEI